MTPKHQAIFIDNAANKRLLFDMVFQKTPSTSFSLLKNKKGALFSKAEVSRFINDENRHGTKTVTSHTRQSLKTMSSGEQKKVLLEHILRSNTDFIVLDNPFDNLDERTRTILTRKLETICHKTLLIQIVSRKADVLPFIETYTCFNNARLTPVDNLEQLTDKKIFNRKIPSPLSTIKTDTDTLVHLKNISIGYLEKKILKNIDWKIKKGDFWELRGNNGSGKTTVLSMITGENPKAYGQEIYLFGQKKGSGESVWDIKKKIGYFTPSMTDTFKGSHTVEHMLISGLTDTVGLYTKPTERQIALAQQWLQVIDMWHLKDTLFNRLSPGQKRLIMCARAMVKHPPLLILDEPTAGLDDLSASLVVALVNAFAKESTTAIVFVSHRAEEGLEPNSVYELHMTPQGSTGNIIN